MEISRTNLIGFSKTFMQNNLKLVAITSKYNGLESLNMFKLTMEEDEIKYFDSSYSSTSSNELYLCIS